MSVGGARAHGAGLPVARVLRRDRRPEARRRERRASPRSSSASRSSRPSAPAADWRAYLRWHLLQARPPTAADARSSDEHFDFYERALQRHARPPPRAQARAAASSAAATAREPMAQALGQLYVERAFPPEAKARALRDGRQREGARSRDRLRELDWMSEETRAARAGEARRHAREDRLPRPLARLLRRRGRRARRSSRTGSRANRFEHRAPAGPASASPSTATSGA